MRRTEYCLKRCLWTAEKHARPRLSVWVLEALHVHAQERRKKEREQAKEQRKVEKELRAAEERRKSVEMKQAAKGTRPLWRYC